MIRNDYLGTQKCWRRHVDVDVNADVNSYVGAHVGVDEDLNVDVNVDVHTRIHSLIVKTSRNKNNATYFWLLWNSILEGASRCRHTSESFWWSHGVQGRCFVCVLNACVRQDEHTAPIGQRASEWASKYEISDTTTLASAVRVSISYSMLSNVTFFSHVSHCRNTCEPLWWSVGVHGACVNCVKYRWAAKRKSYIAWAIQLGRTNKYQKINYRSFRYTSTTVSWERQHFSLLAH